MIRLSANLGFLWAELPLPGAIRAAADAGFEAVEFHWPYDLTATELKAALDAAGLPALGINTVRGDVQAGENGLAALPGREAEARAAIKQAFDYGAAIGARNVHVMAGFASGPAARETYLGNLSHAADRAALEGMNVLIEPLNSRDAPGYFIQTADAAADIIAALGRAEVRMMFDCYHLQIMQGDLTRLYQRMAPMVGHIQFAAVPGRGAPDEGEIAFDRLLPALAALGYDGFFGAEYRPAGPTSESLGWMRAFR